MSLKFDISYGKGVKMPEVADNVQNDQSDISGDQEHEIQGNENLDTGNEENDKETEETSEKSESKPEDASVDDLPLPEPDVDSEEVKKKKEMPEWMKKKLEREKAAAEREKSESLVLKAEIERLKGEGQQKPVVSHSDPNFPKRDQFNNDEEYFFALADYREEARARQTALIRREEAFKKAETDYQNRVQETVNSGREKYKDFDERTDFILYGEGFPSNRAMGEAIFDSEFKDDILYFLGTNVKKAEEIARMNPIQAVKEITKLETRFLARKKTNITKAPNPLAPLNSNQGKANYGDPNKMDMDDFREWYEDTQRAS